MVVGEVRGAVALVMILAGIIRKMDIEETLLNKNFPDMYSEYMKRVKRLIPFVM